MPKITLSESCRKFEFKSGSACHPVVRYRGSVASPLAAWCTFAKTKIVNHFTKHLISK